MPSTPAPYSYEWWILYVVPLATSILLLGTLVVTVLVALAGLRQAKAATQSADAAMRQTDLNALVQIRPLLSITQVTTSFSSGQLRSLTLVVENAGEGPCFNLALSVSGYADHWRVSVGESDSHRMSGALSKGCQRQYVAEPVPSGGETGFDMKVKLTMECFDILRKFYIFEQEFLINSQRSMVLDTGLNVRGPLEGRPESESSPSDS